MSEHTAGPWEVVEDDNEQPNIYSGGEWIALLPHQCVESILETQRANARLIAAAPELLEALENLTEACTPTPLPDEPICGVRIPEQPVVEAARAAIQHATGENHV